MNLDKFTITSYDQFIGFDRTTGNLELVMDELTDFTLSQEEEKVDLTGKGGRTIGSLKKNKKVTGRGTNGMLVGGALAAMTGSEIEDGSFPIRYTDRIIVTSSENGALEGETKATATGTSGNEIGTIYVRDSDNQAYISGGKKLTQVSKTPANAGEFSYDPDTNKITFYSGTEDEPADVTAGVEVIAFYNTEVSGKKISNDSDKYSKTLQSFIDVTCQDACDNLFHGQFIIERADFNGTFEIAGGSDPATLGFEFTSLPNICTGKTDLWDFIIFD